jgi:hypothetical protein
MSMKSHAGVRSDRAAHLTISSAPPTPQTAPPWGFPEWFILSQLALPCVLFLPGTQTFRVPIRIAPFAISLAALLWWCSARLPKRNRLHPAYLWLLPALVYLGLMILHPAANSLLAGLAQAMLYLSVLAPVFWAPSLVGGPGRLVRLLGILLIYNGINAAIGVLQVYDPDRWMPAELSRVVEASYELHSLSYERADGQVVLRPPGLSDYPGAVCGPGTVAALLGLIFCTWPIALWKKLLALAFASAGIMAIWLSLVRTNVLILAGSLAVYATILAVHKQWSRLIVFLSLASSAAVASFSLAILLGGTSIAERFATLIEHDPITVYYNNGRAGWLTEGFSYFLAEYPLGAGLGRWGMMQYYFGDPNNLQSPPIFAELQIIAWILDGGYVLLIFYAMALLTTAGYELRIAMTAPSDPLRSCAALVFAVNVGTVALVFGFTPFTTQVGMQFWFLTGALHGLVQASTRVRH